MPFPDIEKFFSDPAFQKDREFFDAVVDRRLKHHAEERAKLEAQNKPVGVLEYFFGSTPPTK